MTGPGPIDDELAWVDALMDGIDKDECEYEHGWWETSTGAEFGAMKLRALKTGIRRRYLT